MSARHAPLKTPQAPLKAVVAAAWDPELERFRALAQPYFGSSSAHLRCEAVGIGLVDTTAGMARCILHHSPTHVFLIGTCGASRGSGLSIGDVIVGTSVRLIDPTVVEGRAAMPYAAEAIALDEKMIDAVFAAGAREATIMSTLGITTDDALAAKLAPLAQVEHLESYGVARACHAAGIACGIVLCAANAVGSRGREEWRLHHATASARAAEIAWKAFSTIKTSTTARSPG